MLIRIKATAANRAPMSDDWPGSKSNAVCGQGTQPQGRGRWPPCVCPVHRRPRER